MSGEQEILEELMLFREALNSQLDDNIIKYGEEMTLCAESLGFLFASLEHHFHMRFTKNDENTIKLVKFTFLSMFNRFESETAKNFGEILYALTLEKITSDYHNHYKVGYFFAANIPMVAISNIENLNIWGRYIGSLVTE